MRCRVERGAATVVTVAAVGVVLVVLSAALVLAGTVRDVHRARAAADLAALAAAVPLADGLAADCSAARSVAVANGATVVDCTAAPDASVVVAVSVARHWSRGWRWLPPDVSARARAGVLDGSPDGGGGVLGRRPPTGTPVLTPGGRSLGPSGGSGRGRAP